MTDDALVAVLPVCMLSDSFRRPGLQRYSWLFAGIKSSMTGGCLSLAALLICWVESLVFDYLS
jgi:hypothetical protein